jgi:hypothetical protein
MVGFLGTYTAVGDGFFIRRQLAQESIFFPQPVFPYCRCDDYKSSSNPYTLSLTATTERLTVGTLYSTHHGSHVSLTEMDGPAYVPLTEIDPHSISNCMNPCAESIHPSQNYAWTHWCLHERICDVASPCPHSMPSRGICASRSRISAPAQRPRRVTQCSRGASERSRSPSVSSFHRDGNGSCFHTN